MIGGCGRVMNGSGMSIKINGHDRSDRHGCACVFSLPLLELDSP